MEYFINALTNYADFTGRARRREYWYFNLYYFIFFLIVIVLDAVSTAGGFTALYSLAMIVPSVSVLVRRLHDTSRTAWWLLLILIPVVGQLILLYFLVQDSHQDNEYGYNPKGGILC
ncbi:DUF805 domain-containing protein [Marinomonas sp. PE14-40]|uniref:DUF805 domain-containing protein n=1 Tax=Marinomonas sp. PE14-40 TaxID=3060621 RepID=UPI003F66A415